MAVRHIISDSHFNHGNIILYENRPFSCKEEMNNYMIEKWNSIVAERDKVFHLGDFSFGNKEFTKELISKLNGDIALILGNHDRSKTDSWWTEVGIKNVYRYPIIMDEFFILSHEPIYLNKNMPYMNIHGHIHSNNLDNPQYINMGVENYDYEPQNLDKIFENFSQKDLTFSY